MEREGKSTERITVARDRHRERDGGGGGGLPLVNVLYKRREGVGRHVIFILIH